MITEAIFNIALIKRSLFCVALTRHRGKKLSGLMSATDASNPLEIQGQESSIYLVLVYSVCVDSTSLRSAEESSRPSPPFESQQIF
jgi:hypothetical protein